MRESVHIDTSPSVSLPSGVGEDRLEGCSEEMEYFDIVDEKGNPLGGQVEREIAHRDGIMHRTAHIWVVRRETGEVLLQKRCLAKDSFPGRYDTSSAGHIQAGDEPLESALRELEEELGIRAEAEDLHFADTFRNQYEEPFHGQMFKDNEVSFVYVYEKPVEISDMTLQEEEIESVAWFKLDQVIEAVEQHDPMFCVPMAGLMIAKRYMENHGKPEE